MSNPTPGCPHRDDLYLDHDDTWRCAECHAEVCNDDTCGDRHEPGDPACKVYQP